MIWGTIVETKPITKITRFDGNYGLFQKSIPLPFWPLITIFNWFWIYLREVIQEVIRKKRNHLKNFPLRIIPTSHRNKISLSNKISCYFLFKNNTSLSNKILLSKIPCYCSFKNNIYLRNKILLSKISCYCPFKNNTSPSKKILLWKFPATVPLIIIPLSGTKYYCQICLLKLEWERTLCCWGIFRKD